MRGKQNRARTASGNNVIQLFDIIYIMRVLGIFLSVANIFNKSPFTVQHLVVHMPGMSGIELQAELTARRQVLPVIIMTGAADVAMAVHAMKAGAMDFIEKPFETASLLALIHAAFDRDARQQKALAKHLSAARNHSLLTGREHEVFDLVVQDKSCKAIASELGISHRTVETHRSRILTKMNAGSLTELMRTANGLRTKH